MSSIVRDVPIVMVEIVATLRCRDKRSSQEPSWFARISYFLIRPNKAAGVWCMVPYQPNGTAKANENKI